MKHDAQDLIDLFNAQFEASHNTVLVRGDDEPLYLPADADNPRHRIIFAHGFFASALHEIAHWCIAGRRRRMQVDYGYWYLPDGRDADEQREFERVEEKPQAIEWAFHIAAGSSFRISVDNLSGAAVDVERFRRRVFDRLDSYQANGFPARAQRFIEILCNFYRREWHLPEAPRA
ncbi:elongation factor P hydroxylase [Wenzhouxiangella sp. EGI_FJ10409]|uniref:elongation factor P hydroxylase n=1 Tax=Wenzhouxiangella sp. EGI_FJ10409 TaxID=3243767 RepID=UPI0035D9449A